MRVGTTSLWIVASVLNPSGAFLSIDVSVPYRFDRQNHAHTSKYNSLRFSWMRFRRPGDRVMSIVDNGDTTKNELAEGKKRTDAGVVAATGATGALFGWCFARSLDLDVDLLGAVAGCIIGLGLTAQEGKVGEAATSVGEFTLAAFGIIKDVVMSTDVPSKVVGTVGEEILEVVEYTSSAVTKGYMDGLPSPDVKLQEEIDATKARSMELEGKLDQANQALDEARQQLKQRAENERVVESAKATSEELKALKATLLAKDAGITESLDLAEREKEAFDQALKEAKDETARYRQIIEERTDMDDKFKALIEASDTLEQRVKEYEDRLRTLTTENDSIRADYAEAIDGMQAERTEMRGQISSLEDSLATAESRRDEERSVWEAELARMATVLEETSIQADFKTRRVAELQEETERLRKVEQTAADQLKAQEAITERERKEARLMEEAQKAQNAERAKQVAEHKEREERERAAARLHAEKVEKQVRDEAEQRRAELEATTTRAAQRAKEEQALDQESTKAQQATSVLEATDSVAGGREAQKGQGLPSRSSLMRFTVKDLRERCKETGVSTTGKKADLVDRLLEASRISA